jgi:hypothetical protein
MACDTESLLADSCTANLAGLSDRQLLILSVVAALNAGTVLSASDAIAQACEANLPGLSDRELDILILTKACELTT